LLNKKASVKEAANNLLASFPSWDSTPSRGGYFPWWQSCTCSDADPAQ